MAAAAKATYQQHHACWPHACAFVKCCAVCWVLPRACVCLCVLHRVLGTGTATVTVRALGRTGEAAGEVEVVVVAAGVAVTTVDLRVN